MRTDRDTRSDKLESDTIHLSIPARDFVKPCRDCDKRDRCTKKHSKDPCEHARVKK